MKTSQRQSRFQRDPHRHARMVLSERDLDIIAATVEHPYLTLEEIRKLFFGVDNGYKAAARRLQRLWNAGLLARHYIPVLFGSSPALYSPTPTGLELLLAGQRFTPEEIPWRAKQNHLAPGTLRHELAVNKLVTQLVVAVAERYELWSYEAHPSRTGGRCLVKRIDMPRLRETLSIEQGAHLWDCVENPDPAEKPRYPYIPIRPDRLVVLKRDDYWRTFLLEVEIAAKSQARFRRRIRGYRAYYQSGGFLRRYGEGSDPAQYPFTVLVTAPTEERRNNLIEGAIRERALRMCWFAVYDEAVADPLGPVWLRGEEYTAALSHLSEREMARLYQTHRRLERDTFIREHVRALNLLET